MTKIRINQEYHKEALDRCISFTKMLDEVVLNHPVIEQSEQLSHLIQGAKSQIDAVAQLLVKKAKDNDGRMLDRAFWMFEMVNELLAYHPVIAKDRDSTIYAQQAADALWKLYQHIGSKG